MKRSLTLMIEEPRVDLSGEAGALGGEPAYFAVRALQSAWRGDKRNGRRPSRGEASASSGQA